MLHVIESKDVTLVSVLMWPCIFMVFSSMMIILNQGELVSVFDRNKVLKRFFRHNLPDMHLMHLNIN